MNLKGKKSRGSNKERRRKKNPRNSISTLDIAAFHLHHVANETKDKVKERPKIHLKGRALQFAMNLLKHLRDSNLRAFLMLCEVNKKFVPIKSLSSSFLRVLFVKV